MTEAVIHPSKRLGAVMSPDDPRTLRLANYFDPKVLAPAPPSIIRSTAVKSYGMYLNDSLGDCVIAAMGHADESWLALGQSALPPVNDQTIEQTYAAITGYKPADPNSDRGTVILDALRYWRATGFANAGRKVIAFASVDIHNRPLVIDGIFYLDGLMVGVNLPIAAQRMGQHWTRPRNLRGSNAPNSWGGHAVWAVDYDRYGVTVVSWGELIRVDWAFWTSYVEEAWAVLSPETILPTGKDGDGFDLVALRTDLGQIGKAG